MWWTEAGKRLAATAACAAATACAGADVPAKAAPPGVCPMHAGAAVTQIDLFDGDPAEEAYLAPDADDGKGQSVYTLKPIYDEGRTVTIRCHYGSAAAEDVKLTKPVARCVYSEGHGGPLLRCG